MKNVNEQTAVTISFPRARGPAMRGVSSSRNLPAKGNEQYVTRNSAPRLVYEAKLAGAMRRTRISNLK